MIRTADWLKEPANRWQNPRIRVLVIVLAAIGVLLILWPGAGKSPKSASPGPPVPSSQNTARPAEEELAQALSAIDGAGRVEVKLNLASDGLRTYAFNDQQGIRKIQEKDKQGLSRETREDNTSRNMVLSNNAPVLLENKTPEVIGALVVAEGAKDPVVEESLAQAVMDLLNIPASRVRVLPMDMGGAR